jgi:site-specific DNA recombinase
VLAIFDKMRVEDEGVHDWFCMVLASQTRDVQADSRAQLQRQESLIVAQQDRLLNLRLAQDIDQETFARKHMKCVTGSRPSCATTPGPAISASCKAS